MNPNPILVFIYYTLKVILVAVLRLFYSPSILLNKENIKSTKAPLIVVSNHPSTLMDPLNTASRVPYIVHFLANAGLFKKKLHAWFFSTLFCIPIQRQEDTGGKPLKNRESFAKVDEFLTKGGCLYIAPEGNSWMNRTILTLKTGTARMALSAENKNDFDLGVAILPFGLTYDSSNTFRTGLVVNVGEPIYAKEFQEKYKENPFDTAREMTRLLESRLRSLIIEATDEAEDDFFRQLEMLLDSSDPKDQKSRFFRMKALTLKTRDWQSEQAESYGKFRIAVDQYFKQLDQYKLKDWGLVQAKENSFNPWLSGLLMLIGFPLFLYGFINNILPASIPYWLEKKLKVYVGYGSTIKMVSGIFIFPLFYLLQGYFFHQFFDSSWGTALYLLSLIPVGLFSLWYWRQGVLYSSFQKAKGFLRSQQGEAEKLWKKRQELWEDLRKLLND